MLTTVVLGSRVCLSDSSSQLLQSLIMRLQNHVMERIIAVEKHPQIRGHKNATGILSSASMDTENANRRQKGAKSKSPLEVEPKRYNHRIRASTRYSRRIDSSRSLGMIRGRVASFSRFDGNER